MLPLRLAIREIVNNRKFSAIYCLNLALGLGLFISLLSLKNTLHNNLLERSKDLLAADLSISGIRPLDTKETGKVNKIVGPQANTSQLISLYSMVSAKSSRLARIVAIDEQYPFYGQIKLENAGIISSTSDKNIIEKPYVWLYPELLTQLGARRGDRLKIGDFSFEINDTVLSESSTVSSSFALAPAVFIGRSFLQSTNLILPGSRIHYSYLYQLPPGKDVEQVASDLNVALGKGDFNIKTHKAASENLSSAMTQLHDYLGLTALVSLFLSSLGIVYLFRSYLLQRLSEVATLFCLGANAGKIQLTYLWQLLILGVIAGLIAIAFNVLLLPLLGSKLFATFQLTVSSQFSFLMMLGAIALGIVASLVMCLPLLLRLAELNPAYLFQEQVRWSLGFSTKSMLGYVPGLLIFWLLAMLTAQSFYVGSLFFVGFIFVTIILSILILGCLLVIDKLSFKQSIRAKITFRNLLRHRASTVACFLAIGLGAFLISFIPQVKRILQADLSHPENYELPSLFLFDIQQEQLDLLKTHLETFQQTLLYASPLIRARLEKINDQEVAVYDQSKSAIQTREEQRKEQFQRRNYNLSFREELSYAEKIVKGQPFDGVYHHNGNRLPQISLEVRYADRLGLKVGDQMEFDVQGVNVRGEIVNLRQVKWTSFLPNFFVQFQPGVLDDAPKTFVAAIAKLNHDKRTALQQSLVEKFPNISIVDVEQTIDRILVFINRMTDVLHFMAILTMVAGFIVLYSIANHQAYLRRYQTALLAVLGAQFKDIQIIMILEFAFISFVAALAGISLSLLMSFAVTKMIFDSYWLWNWHAQALEVTAITALCMMTSVIATRRILQTKPIILLNETMAR